MFGREASAVGIAEWEETFVAQHPGVFHLSKFVGRVSIHAERLAVIIDDVPGGEGSRQGGRKGKDC